MPTSARTRHTRDSRGTAARSRDRRGDAADPSVIDIRPAGPGQASRLRVLAHATTPRAACSSTASPRSKAASTASRSRRARRRAQRCSARCRPGDHVIASRRRVRRHVPLDGQGVRAARHRVHARRPDRRRARVARRVQPEHQAGVGGDAHQSAAQAGRPRGGSAQWCKPRGLALVVDNTFATPVLQRPLALGARAVRALDHQVPEWSQRRGRWRDRHARRRARTAPALSAERDRRGAFAVRLLPGAARPQDACRCACASTRRLALALARFLERAAERAPGALSGPTQPSAVRARAASDGAARRHDQL